MPDHRWRPFIERSALALKGLSYAPTGAIMAAATTSLPETPGGERNWDYRYTWIRDSAFMLRALHGLGFDWEAFEYFAFLIDTRRAAARSTPASICRSCTASGASATSTEHTLDHLSGYRGLAPGAHRERCVRPAPARRLGHAARLGRDPARARAVRSPRRCGRPCAPGRQGDRARTRARPGDLGDARRTEALRRVEGDVLGRRRPGCALANLRGDDRARGAWQKAADEIDAEVFDEGSRRPRCLPQHYDTDDLDASTLLFPIMGFLPPDDERVRATVLAIADELTQDDLVLRYRVDSADDGLPTTRKARSRSARSGWSRRSPSIGEVERAHALFEKLLSFAGPLHLYAEEIDATTGQHLGNFPQAFTHLALIDAANR